MASRKLQDRIKEYMTDVARGKQSAGLSWLNLKRDFDIFSA